MNDVDKKMRKMIVWCDKVGVKWKDGGTKKVAPVYKYNNHNCTKNGGYCHFCKRSRKKALHSSTDSSFKIASYSRSLRC